MSRAVFVTEYICTERMITIATSYMPPTDKRIFVICGHYGSGKTEYAVSLAMLLSSEAQQTDFKKLALIDLDIANPYFRSRERKDLLRSAGVDVYSNVYDAEITAELPALTAEIRTPLENDSCRVIIDLGGNDAGARVLNQFSKYLNSENSIMLAVINANRPDTHTIDGALEHIRSIETETGFEIGALINNCHLLRETTPDTIGKGHEFCSRLSEITGKPLWCDCYPAPIVNPSSIVNAGPYLMPLGLFMRESWLDK